MSCPSDNLPLPLAPPRGVPVKRRFIDADSRGRHRCAAVVTLRDRSEADCGRAAVDQGLCRQHRACLYRCCGGNDTDSPPVHAEDCSEHPGMTMSEARDLPPEQAEETSAPVKREKERAR